MEAAIDVLLAILGAGLIAGTVTDLQSMRVPNALTFGLMAVGLVAQQVWGQGIGFGLQGVGVAFALHFLLYLIKLEGAGDAKLMMGVGAIIGWQAMIEATVWRYLLLIPYAAIVLTVKGRWGNFRAALQWSLAKAKGAPVGERPEPTYMPFAPHIMISVIAALSSDWLDFFA